MNKYLSDRYRSVLIFLLLVTVLATSCSTTKNVTYFEDIQGRTSARLDSIAQFTKPVIQVDDILSVSIFTINPTTAATVNQSSNIPVLGSDPNGAAPTTAGFLVDENGEIELTGLGRVKVAGLTTTEARELIRQKAERYYKTPNVQVRFTNFLVTVLGEVNAPATYTMAKEKVSVLEAIGLAKDLTIYGRRDNVLLIRDVAGTKQYVRLNLNSTDIFKSPFFYLKQNDVIYVEPTKARAAANNANRVQTIGVITSIITVLVIVFTNLK